MKQILYIITIIVIITTACTINKESDIQFVKVVYDLNNKEDSITFAKWKMQHISKSSDTAVNKGGLYYSDSEFEAFGECMGEFGGSLMFVDRRDSSNVYYLQCTCPVMIEKRTNGYYITESLAHMEGHGSVRQIASPHELIRIPKDSFLTNWKEVRFLNLTRQERNNLLKNQGEVILDTVGLTFNMFFNHNNVDYLIYSDYYNTYLGEVSNQKIKNLDTLLYKPTWGHNDRLNDKLNGFEHYNFARKSKIIQGEIVRSLNTSGDMYVRNDTIVIAYKFNEAVEK